ncbi:MAG TPA: fibrobacter succinogenes major paralogous domain-containing protein [Chitinispirillaceae bacterium]|nr:fibrobacter succinogenes major paralogous domain-containing protein [Chitinispirillaceae bacterium]
MDSDDVKNQHEHKASPAETMTDIDGNLYTSIKIGKQIWAVEDLRTTKLNDGNSITYAPEISVWAGLNSPGYCFYDNDPSTGSIYGALYNWFAVSSGKLAPKGWHVPTDSEWLQLKEYLIRNGYNWDGTKEGNKIAKAMASTSDWAADGNDGTVGNDLSKNNRSGFTALPCGCRNDLGCYLDLHFYDYWWSATEANMFNAYRYYLGFNHSDLSGSSYFKQYGLSVRLVKD